MNLTRYKNNTIRVEYLRYSVRIFKKYFCDYIFAPHYVILHPAHRRPDSQIAAALGQQSLQPEGLTLEALLSMDAAFHMAHLEEICTAAEKEYQVCYVGCLNATSALITSALHCRHCNT